MSGKSKNKTLIVACCALLAALVCAVAALALGATDKAKWLDVSSRLRGAQGLHEVPIEKSVSLSAEGVDKLKIDLNGGMLSFDLYDGDEITLDYFEEYEGETVASVEDGALIINRDLHYGSMINYDCNRSEIVFGTGFEWWLYEDYKYMTLKLPRTLEFITTNIDISGGSVNGVSAVLGKTDIEVSGGGVELHCPISSIGEIDVSGGYVKLTSSEISSVDKIDVSGGGVEIWHASLSGQTRIDVSGGGVKFDNVTIDVQTVLSVDISGGGVTFSNVFVDKESIAFNVDVSGGVVYLNDTRISNGHYGSTTPICLFNVDISGGGLYVSLHE